MSNPNDPEYHLNEQNYTIEEVSNKAKRFLFDGAYRAAYPDAPPGFFMGYRVCGYSAGTSLAEVWEFLILGADCEGPRLIQNQQDFGMRWAGENEALDRLLLGTSSQIKPFLIEKGFQPQVAEEAYLELVRQIGAGLGSGLTT